MLSAIIGNIGAFTSYSMLRPGLPSVEISGSKMELVGGSSQVITPVINGISRVNPLITGVITYLPSGMSHQVVGGFKHVFVP